MDTDQHRDAIPDLVVAVGGALDIVGGQPDLARFQRAVEGAEQSGAGRTDQVVDWQWPIGLVVEAVMGLDGAVDADIELLARRQGNPSVYAFHPLDTGSHCIERVAHFASAGLVWASGAGRGW